MAAKPIDSNTNDWRDARKTMIVTGASQGIGAGITRAFLDLGCNVVANSRGFADSGFTPGERLALVEGDVGEMSTAERLVNAAITRFERIDAIINNAGIFFAKPFTDYTAEDFALLTKTNLTGYINITQLAVRRMVAQGTGGSVVCITSAMVEHPIAGVPSSLPMITKGGLEAITRSLAMEYAKDGIRFNAVAPGVVKTPMHADNPEEDMKAASPMGVVPEVDDIVEAVVYLTSARCVTGEVLHVDGGMHNGKW